MSNDCLIVCEGLSVRVLNWEAVQRFLDKKEDIEEKKSPPLWGKSHSKVVLRKPEWKLSRHRKYGYLVSWPVGDGYDGGVKEKWKLSWQDSVYNYKTMDTIKIFKLRLNRGSRDESRWQNWLQSHCRTLVTIYYSGREFFF